MHFSTSLVLIAALASSALGGVLAPRATICKTLSSTTTTVGGIQATLAGPFHLIDTAKSGSLHKKGQYATINDHEVIFNSLPSDTSDHASFFIGQNGHLVHIANGVYNTAYVDTPTTTTNYGPVTFGNAALMGSSKLADILACSFDSTSCALNCAVGMYTNVCLYEAQSSTPKWELSKVGLADHPCLPFTPKAVQA